MNILDNMENIESSSPQIKQIHLRLDDGNRIQNVVDELNRKQVPTSNLNSSTKTSVSTGYIMESKAKELVMKRAEEITKSILENACKLATHRDSAEITVQDIQLLFEKKYGIELPGYPRLKSSHHQTLKNTLATTSSSISSAIVGTSVIPQYMPNIPNKIFFPQSSVSDKETCNNNSNNVNIDRNKPQQGIKRKYTRSDKGKQPLLNNNKNDN